MRNSQKTKSRSKLYNAIGGVKELTGASGVMGTWTILFPNLAAVGDTIKVGPYYWEYVADGGEDAALDSAGTAADPHLISIGGTPTATTAAANLVTSLLAETDTSGAWGFLYPDDSVGASNSAGTVTIRFWPGTAPNATGYVATVSSVGTDPTVTKTVTGVAAKVVSPDYYYNFINTTGSAQTKELYVIPDGSKGDIVRVMTTVSADSDTPTLLGHLLDGATANVEALFAAGQDGMTVEFVWTGSGWLLTREGIGTALVFTAAA